MFYCEFCQHGFNFVSKCNVHLRSSGHRALEDILKKEVSHGNQAEDPALAITSEEQVSNVTGIYIYKSSMLCLL